MIGPYVPRDILLCAADASPNSQRRTPGPAGGFFPGGKWVGAVRNSAKRRGCPFLILTTKYGMVTENQEIKPYDLHIDMHRGEVGRIWRSTVPSALENNPHKLMLFYAGGCPRESYVELLMPMLMDKRINLLAFGRPNMYDIGKLDAIVNFIVAGTTLEAIRSIMKLPDRLEYFQA